MRNVSRRSFGIRAGVCALSLVASQLACLSPTLPPLPPPDAPSGLDYEFGSSDQLLIEGYVPATDAYVFVINKDNSEIAGQFTPTGYYNIRLRARPGDYLELWYEQGVHSSSVRGFEAPLLTPAPPRPDAGTCGVGDSTCPDAGSEAP